MCRTHKESKCGHRSVYKLTLQLLLHEHHVHTCQPSTHTFWFNFPVFSTLSGSIFLFFQRYTTYVYYVRVGSESANIRKRKNTAIYFTPSVRSFPYCWVSGKRVGLLWGEGEMPRKGRDKDKLQSPGQNKRPAAGAEAMPQVWLPDQVYMIADGTMTGCCPEGNCGLYIWYSYL